MPVYEYKVVAAPRRGLKVKGARTAEDRFAAALETLMNELGAQGWDYVRADTLPSEERQGLTGRTTVWQNMLVFRRERPAMAEAAPSAPVLRRPEAALVPLTLPVAAESPAAPPLGPATEVGGERRLAAE